MTFLLQPTKVIFGKGTELCGEEVAKYSDKVLLHYGGGSAERSGLLTGCARSFGPRELRSMNWRVKSNPRLDLVFLGKLSAVPTASDSFFVPGGSVIDSAKTIACGAEQRRYSCDLKMAQALLPPL